MFRLCYLVVGDLVEKFQYDSKLKKMKQQREDLLKRQVKGLVRLQECFIEQQDENGNWQRVKEEK